MTDPLNLQPRLRHSDSSHHDLHPTAINPTLVVSADPCPNNSVDGMEGMFQRQRGGRRSCGDSRWHAVCQSGVKADASAAAIWSMNSARDRA